MLWCTQSESRRQMIHTIIVTRALQGGHILRRGLQCSLYDPDSAA